MAKKWIFEQKLPFLSIYSNKIAHLATFFLLKIPLFIFKISIGSFSYFFLKLYCVYPKTDSKLLTFLTFLQNHALTQTFMKQKKLIEATRICTNQILYNFTLMLLFDISTLNGQKNKKKRLSFSKNS